MKNVLRLIMLSLLVPCVGWAQSNKEDIDLIRSIYGKSKKELTASFIQLDASKSDAFWKIYDEYETKRKTLGQKRIAVLEKYANTYGNATDAQIDEIMKEVQSIQEQTDKLIVQYYAKIKKDVGVKPAAQFYQLEGYLLSAVRASILDSIPFIGELEKKH